MEYVCPHHWGHFHRFGKIQEAFYTGRKRSILILLTHVCCRAPVPVRFPETGKQYKRTDFTVQARKIGLKKHIFLLREDFFQEIKVVSIIFINNLNIKRIEAILRRYSALNFSSQGASPPPVRSVRDGLKSGLYDWYTNIYKIFFLVFFLSVWILVRIFAAWKRETS